MCDTPLDSSLKGLSIDMQHLYVANQIRTWEFSINCKKNMKNQILIYFTKKEHETIRMKWASIIQLNWTFKVINTCGIMDQLSAICSRVPEMLCSGRWQPAIHPHEGWSWVQCFGNPGCLWSCAQLYHLSQVLEGWSDWTGLRFSFHWEVFKVVKGSHLWCPWELGGGRISSTL